MKKLKFKKIKQLLENDVLLSHLLNMFFFVNKL